MWSRFCVDGYHEKYYVFVHVITDEMGSDYQSPLEADAKNSTAVHSKARPISQVYPCVELSTIRSKHL